MLFAEYVARDLADRLAAARSRLQEARDRVGGGDPASGELVAALDGVLSAIDDLARSDPSLQRRSNRGALALATLRGVVQTLAAQRARQVAAEAALIRP